MAYDTTLLDQTPPVIAISDITTEQVTMQFIEAEIVDEKSNLAGYALTTEDVEPTVWNDLNSKKDKVDLDIDANGTYYLYVKDVLGNVNKQIIEISNITGS